MDGTCEYSNVCGRDALDGHDGKCILHSENSDKGADDFEKALEEHREEDKGDFRWMVFPREVDFSGEIFEVEAYFQGTTFQGKAAFREATFERGAYFQGATFEAEATFWKATFKEEAYFQGITCGGEAYFREVVFQTKVNFGKATFESGAYLQKTTFEGEPHFRKVTFEGKGNFEDAAFEADGYFRWTTFNECSFVNVKLQVVYFWNASFEVAYFGDATVEEAHFGNATIGGGNFGNATFKVANFTAATFDGGNFNGATFEKAHFEDVTFEAEARFREVTFEKANFEEATFKVANFENATFNGKAVFERSFESQEDVQFALARLNGCQFNDDAVFSGESEEEYAFANGEVDFEDVIVAQDASLHFRYADLSRCRFLRTDLRDVEFTGIKWCEEVSSDGQYFDEWFSWEGLYDEVYERNQDDNAEGGKADREKDRETEETPPWSEIERLYRQLKRNYEERGDFPRAGDFHIGEKEARRKNPQTPWGTRFLLTVYRALSKYGERALPSALWLAFMVFGFAVLYYLLGATTLAKVGAVTYPEAFIHSLEATFYPVRSVGFLTFWSQFFSIVQRVISPVLIALLALALRQRVKR